MTIDPNHPTDFFRTVPQLEEFALFGTMVPTKRADQMAKLLDAMLMNARLVYGQELSPFEIVRIWIANGILGERLRYYRVGQYTRLERCWTELVREEPRFRATAGGNGPGTNMVIEHMRGVDLRSVGQLEQVYGIGPKTARFIVLHSVPGARCIPIDTHWMSELAQKGYPMIGAVDSRTHPIYERYALAEVAKSGMSCATYDLLVWRKWNAAYQTWRVAA